MDLPSKILRHQVLPRMIVGWITYNLQHLPASPNLTGLCLPFNLRATVASIAIVAGMNFLGETGPHFLTMARMHTEVNQVKDKDLLTKQNWLKLEALRPNKNKSYTSHLHSFAIQVVGFQWFCLAASEWSAWIPATKRHVLCLALILFIFIYTVYIYIYGIFIYTVYIYIYICSNFTWYCQLLVSVHL